MVVPGAAVVVLAEAGTGAEPLEEVVVTTFKGVEARGARDSEEASPPFLVLWWDLAFFPSFLWGAPVAAGAAGEEPDSSCCCCL